MSEAVLNTTIASFLKQADYELFYGGKEHLPESLSPTNPGFTDFCDDEREELAPVRVIGLGDSSVNLRGWAWANDAKDAFMMECELFESIKLRFDAEGIEIPFPHRTLYHRNALPQENDDHE